MVLWKFTLRELKSHPGRATLTLLSIVIAVSAAVAVKVSTATTRQAYQEMYVKLAGRAALEVVPDGEGTYDEAIVGRVEKIPGVAVAAPALQLPTILHFKDGDPHSMLVLGIDPTRDEKVRDYELAAGSFFEGDEGGLLEAGFARSLGIEVGDEVRLMTKRLRQPVKIVGLLTAKGVAGFKQGATITLSLPTVQRLFGQRKSINNTSLVLDPTADVETVRQAIAAVLPPGVTVRMPTSRAQLGTETLATFDQGLTFAYTLTLVLATIVILNTFLMNVGERRRQLAILRALGTTRRQVMGMLLREGLLMGAVGTVAGLILGLAGAYGLSWAMARVYDTSLNALAIGREPFILAGVMGPGMALAAMFVPAYLAGKVTPLEGMRPLVSPEGARPSPVLTLIGLAAFTVMGAGLLASIFGWLPIDMATPIGVVFTVTLIFLIPAVLGPAAAFCAAVLRPIFSTESKLAHRQIVRRRTRSTLTVGVLYVSLSAGIGLGTAILNNVQDVVTWQERTFIGEFFIRANRPDLASGKSVPMPDSVEAELRNVAGVESVDGVRVVEQVTITSVRNGSKPQEVGAVLREFGASDRLPMDLKVGDLDETRSRLRAGEVVIGTVVAHRMGIGAGEEIILQTRQGPQTLRIAGETNDYWLGGRVMYMDRALGRKLLGADGADMYIVHVDKAAPLGEVEARVKAVCSQDGLSLLSFVNLRQRLDDLLNSIIAGLWGIMALGLVVAGFAVANTLTMNVLEQTREIAMLRVVAMTRRQVRRTILAQAAILGLFGVTVGVISGAISSYTMNLCTPAVTGRPIDFALHPRLLVGTYFVALGIILIAAWLPARRATHLNLLIALQYE